MPFSSGGVDPAEPIRHLHSAGCRSLRMARWRRVALARHEVLIVEAGDLEVTVRGTGQATVDLVEAPGEVPAWRKPPLTATDEIGAEEMDAPDPGARRD
jgi:hypothetical protein